MKINSEYVRDYIKRTLLNGYKDSSYTEIEIMEIAVGYLEKGRLIESDIAEIDGTIQAIKQERETFDDENDLEN